MVLFLSGKLYSESDYFLSFKVQTHTHVSQQIWARLDHDSEGKEAPDRVPFSHLFK
jgi:hypothetical protein